ncbi:MAG: hypothetical protein LBP85_07195 [Prevotellaceae bacterium]|jgi:hypothetical protein|nr:hypothetical protein [Prevotellaceae bacterium]
MAENIEKTVLVKADVVSNFIQTKKELDSVKKGYDDLSELLEKIAAEQGKNSEAYKKANAQLAAQAIKLANANNEYRAAKKEIEAAAKSEQIFADINDKTAKSLGEMQRELSALTNVNLSGLDPEQVKQVKQAMADLTSNIQDVKNEIKGLDTGQFAANLAEGIRAVTAGFSVLANGLKILGVEESVLGDLQKKTTELIAIVQALGVVTEYLSKKKWQLIAANIKEIALQIKNIALSIAQKAATLGTAAATLIMGKAANTASLGFKALRAALISTGIGALIVGVGLLIANLDKLLSLFKSSPDKDMVASFNRMSQAYDKAIKDNEKYIKSLQDRGKAESEVLNETIKLQIKMLDSAARLQAQAALLYGADSEMYKNAIENTNEARNALNTTADSMISILDKIVGTVKTANEKKGMSDEEYTKSIIKNNAIQQRSHLALLQSLGKISTLQTEIYWQAINQNEQNLLSDIDAGAAKKAAETQKKAVEERKNTQYKAAKERIDMEIETGQSILEADEIFYKNSFAKQQQFNRKKFENEQKSATEKLKLDLEYGKITQSEYDKQNAILKNRQKKFDNEQLQAAADKIKGMQKETSKLIREQTDQEIADYKAANKTLVADMQKQSGELEKQIEQSRKMRSGKGGDDTGEADPELEKQYKETQAKIAALKTQEQDAINEITKKGLEREAALINQKYDEIYSAQFEKAKNNQIKTLELEQELLQAQINEKKGKGIDTSGDEAALNATRIQLIEANAAKELAVTARTAKQSYEIQRKALEDKQKLYAADSLEWAQIERQKTEMDREFKAQQVETVLQYAEAAIEALNSIKDIMSNMGEAQIEEAEERNSQEKENLKKMLDANLITQTEYDRKVKAADEKLAKEKAKIARKTAIMEKALAIAGIAIDTARGIMGAVKEFPATAGMPWVAIIAALGALQAAAVMSQPLPQAAKGKLIGGRSHAAGGTVIEAERGEAIVNKRSVGLYPELLSLINELGGGVPFVRSYSDGGFAMREYMRNRSNTVDTDTLTEAVAAAVKNINIYTAIEDIRKGNSQYTAVTGESGIGEIN